MQNISKGRSPNKAEQTSFSILFVDDEPQAQKYFSRAFSDHFQVLTAGNAREATSVLKDRGDRIAVLVSDERMPERSGIDLLSEVGRRWPHIVRVLTTAHADLDNLTASINQAEIYRYIPKPWDLDSLREALHSAMSQFYLKRRQIRLVGAHGEALLSLGALLGHEVATPLLSADLSARMIEGHLGAILQAYRRSRGNGSSAPGIDTDVLERLEQAPARIRSEIERVRLLMQSLSPTSDGGPDANRFDVHAMADCVLEALDRFPFPNQEWSRISFNRTFDFLFYGCNVQMVSVVMNLLRNALEAIAENDDGRVAIKLETGERTNRLRIKDTGIGIPSADIERVFDDFYTTKRSGTGLGLAFCRRAIAAFGGTIVCNSKEGSFTEFVLEFPHAAMDAPGQSPVN